jgi:hypothetical protein
MLSAELAVYALFQLLVLMEKSTCPLSLLIQPSFPLVQRKA